MITTLIRMKKTMLIFAQYGIMTKVDRKEIL